MPLMIQQGAATIAMLLAVAAAGVLRGEARRLQPARDSSELDVPAIPAVVARPLAFGLHSLLADVAFLEAIQVFPERRADSTAAASAAVDRRLQNLLTYSVDVDPKFVGAYRFIGTALPHETTDGKATGVLAAVQLLEQGVRERPDDWHIAFLLGFLQSYYVGDYADAARAFAEAAQQKGAPPFLGLLATRMGAQGGDLATAIALASAMLSQANEEDTRKQWEERLASLAMEKDLRAIESAAARYRADHGAWPQSVRSLVAARYLPSEPHEPHGGTYVIHADGSATSTAAERLRVYGPGARFEVH